MDPHVQCEQLELVCKFISPDIAECPHYPVVSCNTDVQCDVEDQIVVKTVVVGIHEPLLHRLHNGCIGRIELVMGVICSEVVNDVEDIPCRCFNELDVDVVTVLLRRTNKLSNKGQCKCPGTS